MKQKNIKDAEITKEMYNEAKKIERMYEKLKKLDCRTEEFKKLSKKTIEAEDKFTEEITDEFCTLEIVNEYKRRKKNKEKNTKKSFEEIELLKKFHVIPEWTTGMKRTKGSIWTKKFIEVGYRPTGWRLCDRFGSWWDEYHDDKEFVYAEQCINYIEKYK